MTRKFDAIEDEKELPDLDIDSLSKSKKNQEDQEKFKFNERHNNKVGKNSTEIMNWYPKNKEEHNKVKEIYIKLYGHDVNSVNNTKLKEVTANREAAKLFIDNDMSNLTTNIVRKLKDKNNVDKLMSIFSGKEINVLIQNIEKYSK